MTCTRAHGRGTILRQRVGNETTDVSTVRWRQATLIAKAQVVLEGLATYDLADRFRRLHPDSPEYSRVWHGRGKGGVMKTVRRRFDHIFASERLGAIECSYVHHVREDGLSDHSAMLADAVSMDG